jgi:hypothetical protein
VIRLGIGITRLNPVITLLSGTNWITANSMQKVIEMMYGESLLHLNLKICCGTFCPGCILTGVKLLQRHILCPVELPPGVIQILMMIGHAFIGCDSVSECLYYAGLSSILLPRLARFNNQHCSRICF